MKLKTTEFNLPRVLILTIIVTFLAFVYFMVRAGYTSHISEFKNPADKVGSEMLSQKLSAKEPYKYKKTKKGFLVVEDSTDPVSVSVRDSIELTLESLGHEPVYTQNPSFEEIRSGWEGIIITRTYLNSYDVMMNLFDYSRDGGLLIFAIRPETDEIFKSLYQQVGIYEHYYYKECKGFHAVPGLLSSGSYDISYDEDGPWLFNSIIELHVRKECNVLATNDEGAPLIWDLDYGQGKILFMNNSLMTYKSSAGLMLSLLAKLKGSLMYPVINAKVFALEAFPLPTDVNVDFLKRAYLRSGSSFLRDLWWPAMARIGATSNIVFTAGILTGYSSEQPYDSDDVLLENMDFSFYAKELSRYGGEIAFTGFNQMPLYFSQLKESMDFEPWSSHDVAKERTKDALTWISKNLPAYNIYSYLPTERVMDQEGYEIIREIFPNLQVVCGDFTDRQRLYQNFKIDEYGIVQFPVVTSGFIVDDMERWDFINLVTSKGVIFHSCSISALMLETDMDNSWNKISNAFSNFCSDYMGNTPLTPLTITQAAARLRDMENLDAKITYDDKKIDVNIENMPEQASFMLLTFDGVPQNQPGINCQTIHENKYLITTTLDKFTLVLK